MLRHARIPVALLLLTCCANHLQAQGLILPGAGPIHRSMAGASTAAPVDAIGANYWNPATISGLPHSEVAFGGEFIYSDMHLSSSAPLLGQSGITRSDNGLAPLSAIGYVQHLEDSPFTIGLMLGSSAGGSVNYPGDNTNPFLSPTGPGGNLRLGPQYASASFLATMMSLSWQVNEKLAIAAGPTITTVLMGLNPAFFATPDDANQDGLATFPSATNGRPFWGAGLRAGAYYHLNENVDLGFSIQSPTWFETFKWKSQNEVGADQTIRLQWTLPTIISFGAAYKGIDRLLLAADVRWFDYRTTEPMGVPASQGGLGWDSIWAFAFGAQYKVSDRMSVGAGYLYNENPISGAQTLFNVQLPGIIKHQLSFGTTMQLTENVAASLAFVQGLENQVSGPVIQGTQSSIAFDAKASSIVFGLNVKFGGSPSKDCCEVETTWTSDDPIPPVPAPVPATPVPLNPSVPDTSTEPSALKRTTWIAPPSAQQQSEVRETVPQEPYQGPAILDVHAPGQR